MADDTDRTEEATPRKKARLHGEGQVPRSADIATAAMLLAMVPMAVLVGRTLVVQVLAMSRRMFRLQDAADPLMAIGHLYHVLWIIAVPVFSAMVIAFGSGVAQARVFTLKPLSPSFGRLNPFPNFKKILPGKDTFVELFKQVVKIGAIGGVVYGVVTDAMPRFTLLPAASVSVGSALIGKAIQDLVIQAGLAFAVVAVLDYLLAVRKFNEDAKMSKEEIRDERKQEDASPEVRQWRRRRMMELGRDVRGALKGATVVVTNPDHYAVALRYENDVDAAPLVLAKGIDDVALRIRSEARKHQVPIVENRHLAKALFRSTQVGKTIPVHLYRAVAEVIAFVIQLRAAQYGVRRGAGT